VVSIPGDVVIGSASVGPDRLILGADNQLSAASDVTIHAPGVLDNNNETNEVASLTFDDGGIVDSTTGRIVLLGNVAVTGTGISNAIINGNLHLGSATRTFDIANTPLGFDLDVNGVISGGTSGSPFFFPAGIIKSGAGVMRVNAANTYGGATTVNDGTLRVNNNLGLGGTFSFLGSAGTFVNSNGVLLLNDAHVTNEVLTLNSINPLGALQVELTADWTGDIILNTNVVIEASSAFGLNGDITGPGGFTKVGSSTLTLRGTNDNTYTGPTVVNAGTLQLDKDNNHSINNSSSLTIGDGTGTDTVLYINANGNQINTGIPITINSSGFLDLNGHSDDVSGITMVGGDITTDAGTITVGGNINVQGSSEVSTIAGRLRWNGIRNVTVDDGAAFNDLRITAVVTDLGSGFRIIKGAGAGAFALLMSSNTFTGPLTIDGLRVDVETPWSLGGTNGITTVTNGGELFVFSTDITNETVVLSTGTMLTAQYDCIWNGPVVLNGNAAINGFTTFGLFDIRGAISGNGNLTSTSGGATNRFSGTAANTYVGATFVNSGILEAARTVGNISIPGDLVIGDGFGGANADQFRIFNQVQINNLAAVTVNASGRFEVDLPFDENIGSLAGSGNMALVGVGARIDTGGNNASTTFSGVISGVGGLQKEGTGTMTLSGDNTYSGTTIVNGGTLLVNGTQVPSPLTVGASGTLGGNGAVGDIAASGTVSPGASPGDLLCGDAAFSGTASFNVEINGSSPGTGYDQLRVFGTNVLAGALNVTVGGGFAPTEGQAFTIIANDGADLVTGTFAGLPDNAIVSAGLHKFRINYGNDVILTYTNPPLDVSVPQVSGGNGNLTIDPNECNDLNLVITNSSGVALSGISAVLSSTTPGVVITQPESDYPDIGINGRGTNTTPFQISTLPSFNCSDDIVLKLTVTSSGGNFAALFSLPSGSQGNPVAFNNNVNLGIVDSGSVTSSIAVAGITTPIKKVTVSLHLTHPSDEDLDISLVSPDGTTINLTSDNGGTGEDYGTDCALISRTVFDDSAPSSIIGNAAPFVGTFRPEQQLSAFIGKEGAAVNGTWQLVITDDAAGSAGTLRCWSVNISPTVCAPGGGACDTCPGTFTGSVTTNDPVRVDRIERFNTPSTCAVPKGCSVYPFDGPYHYDTYTFTNTGGPACITVTLDTPCADALSAEAYLNNHNPTNLCASYLADLDYIPSLMNGAFSFSVPAGAVFVIVVTEVYNNSGCDYTLVVQGIECPPILAIDRVPADRVRLHWPTTAGGYKLEATPALAPTDWSFVTNQPIVTSGRFNVTNSGLNPTNRFYRLHKP